ncbi:MAG: serine protease [Patescibacteria group bacterium]
MLGVSCAIFSGILLWRGEIDRQYTIDRQQAEQYLTDRQTLLEKRIRKVESRNADNIFSLEEQIKRLAEKQKTTAPVASVSDTAGLNFSMEDAIASIVELVCIDNVDREVYYTGSGTVVDRSGLIVTNEHILKSGDGSLIGFCGVGFTRDLHKPPQIEFVATTAAIHKSADLAIMRISERLDGQDLPARFQAVSLADSAATSLDLALGDAIFIGGYPGVGADTFTFTQGVVSGRVGEDLIKTSAFIDTGTSGGAAFDSKGLYVGMPMAAARGDIGGSLGYLIGADIIDDFMKDYYSGLNHLPETLPE